MGLLGAMAGLGQGMSDMGKAMYQEEIDKAKELRDANLRRANADYAQSLSDKSWNEQYDKKRSDAVADAEITGKAKAAEKALELGQIDQKWQDDKGNWKARTKAGEVIDLGAGILKDGSGKKGSGSGSGGKGDEVGDDKIRDWFKTTRTVTGADGMPTTVNDVDTNEFNAFLSYRAKMKRLGNESGNSEMYRAYQEAKKQNSGQGSGGLLAPLAEQKITAEQIDNVPSGVIDGYARGHAAARAAGKEEGMGYLDDVRKRNPVAYAALARRLEKEQQPKQPTQATAATAAAPKGMAPITAPKNAQVRDPGRAPVLDYIDEIMAASTQEFPGRGSRMDLTRQPRLPGKTDAEYNALNRMTTSGFDSNRFAKWAQENQTKTKNLSTSEALLSYAKENPDQKDAVAKIMTN